MDLWYDPDMRTILLAAVLSLAAVPGCSSDKANTGEPADHIPEMSIDEVDKALAAHQVIPVDCNGERTRKKKGVLPGAIIISDEELFEASELPADKTTKLVFYCADPG
jgi:hypothetical protein